MTADAYTDYSKKYGLTATHSEVIAALARVPPGKALDLGCGNGRNSLYLHQQGFEVSAWDKNPLSITNLNNIIASEELSGITTGIINLNGLSFDGEYDFILSTVVMMFLQPTTIPALIANMQRSTRPGGYNLIVAAMDTPDYPCTLSFPFTFKAGELADYYAGWTVHKYNEDVGILHKTDSNGHRISLRFATLLAQKS